MKRKRLAFGLVLLMLAYGGSSCEKLSISGYTVGLIQFIRPDISITHDSRKTSIFEDTRFLPGTVIENKEGSRSTIILDSGVKLVVDEKTKIDATSVDEITVKSGRIFVDADEKEQITIHAGNGKLAVIGSNVSVQVGADGHIKAYTYSGELTYNYPGGNGVARAGESIEVKGNKVDIEPEELWSDWTGGMAEAGPRPMETPVSIGQIYARLPGSMGAHRSPLIIRRHEVRVTIKGDLAITETMQQFFNPSSQVMEGIYKLRLPEDAMLQRFAVDRNGKLVEGYIKEKRSAKQEYESHVYKGSTSDPALLEWVAPGSFKARIYPIKPGQVRTVAFRYSQWLTPSGIEGNTRTYVYPIGNDTIPPQVGEFYLVADVADAGTQIIQAGTGARIEKGRVVFAQSDFRPRSDFFVQLMNVRHEELEENEILMVKTDYRGMIGKLKGKRDETYAGTQFVLRDDMVNLQPEKNLRISVAMDMSAATEQQMVDLAVTFLDSLFGQLNEEDRIAVFAGDIDAEIVGQKEKLLQKVTEDVKEAVIDAVSRHSIGGATDIGNLIMEAAGVSSKEPGGIVIYVGDGFPTVGELDLGSLKERIKRLPNPVRLYGIALGDEANLDLLAGLCAGRGISKRIENRVEAAEAAISLLADASTPVIENITYEIDGGIERVYPARITTLKITQPVHFIGRLTGEKDPENITVRGFIRGKPFEKTYRVKMKSIDDFGDLRMRWAEKRLQTLLDEEEGPESVIELGTRYGIITPFTSFYVPPEEESYNLPEVPPFEIYNFIEGAQAAGGRNEPVTLAETVFGIFMPYGCSKVKKAFDDEEEEQVYYHSPSAAPREASPPGPPAAAPPKMEAEEEGEMDKSTRGIQDKIVIASDSSGSMAAGDKAEAEKRSAVTTLTDGEGGGFGGGDAKSAEIKKKPRGGGEIKKKPKKALPVYKVPPPAEDTGALGLPGSKGTGSGGGGEGYGADLDASLKLVKKGDESYTKTKIYVEQETYTSSTTPSSGTVNLTGKVKKCQETSLMPIDEKVELWKERLGGSPSIHHIMEVFNNAKKKCEIKSAKDRRAFSRLALRLLGSVYSKCRFYKRMKKYPALANYIKKKILSGVKTPDALKTAMQQCDGSIFPTQDEIDKMLKKSKNMNDKIVILKKLVKLYPFDLHLKVMLLDLLEDAGRNDEAVRFADALRINPYVTSEIRTRIGEIYIRIDNKDEAKRVFSEIVEFAPWSYMARRRLGDLYRAYGWYEDAYRQYETLSQMAPNDDSVLILLGEAAILAGRSDEGLRILQQVSQSEPSFEGKITPSEIARVIASLKLIDMRIKTRKEGDEKKLKKLMERTRSTGVIRDSAELKIVLKWDHPDAGFNLSIKFPGSELSKPFRSAPGMGLEWITEKKMPGDDILLQVERKGNSIMKESKATLTIITNEGKENESVKKVKVQLVKKDKNRAAWKLSPDGKITETKIDKTEPYSPW